MNEAMRLKLQSDQYMKLADFFKAGLIVFAICVLISPAPAIFCFLALELICLILVLTFGALGVSKIKKSVAILEKEKNKG